MDASRYGRQTRIAGWNQDALQRARVLVAGAGALGNEVIKNLVLLGVGHLLVVDVDRIEVSNLSRAVLFRAEDITRPKAEVAAEAAFRLNPDVSVRHLTGDLLFDMGLSFYRHADLVIGALDSIVARSQIGTSCALAGTPFLDGGMWALGGEVRWFLPGEGACFECMLTEEDRRRSKERRSCTGFLRETGQDLAERAVPATITTAAIVGGLLAQEAADHLAWRGHHDAEAIVYNGVTLSMHRSALDRDPDCSYHSVYRDIIELEARASAFRGRDLLRRVRQDLGDRAVVELGRDILLGLECDHCGSREEIRALWARVDESRAPCPSCGSARRADVTSRLADDEPHVDSLLSELGVPPGEVLLAHTEEHRALYALSGDVRAVWPDTLDQKGLRSRCATTAS